MELEADFAESGPPDAGGLGGGPVQPGWPTSVEGTGAFGQALPGRTAAGRPAEGKSGLPGKGPSGGRPGADPGALTGSASLWDGASTGRLREEAGPVAVRHEFDRASLEAAPPPGDPGSETPTAPLETGPALAPRQSASLGAMAAVRTGLEATAPAGQALSGEAPSGGAQEGEAKVGEAKEAEAVAGRARPRAAGTEGRPGSEAVWDAGRTPAAGAGAPGPLAEAARGTGAARAVLPEVPAAARPAATAEIEAAPMVEHGSLKELKLEIRAPGLGEEGRSVRLELVEQNGKMEVALRTSDPDMAAELRNSLPALVERLGPPETRAPGPDPGAAGGDGRQQQSGDSPRDEHGHSRRQPDDVSDEEAGPGRRDRAVAAAWREALYRSFRAA